MAEFTKETALQYVKDVLIKNDFVERENNVLQNGNNVIVTIEEEYYKVSHYDEPFLEWVDWFSPDLVIYPLLGYLSFYDFIDRGYKK